MQKFKKQSQKGGSRIAFWMISAVHDNRLLSILKDPVDILKRAGIKHGDRVLEVGCGPGFYTLAASEIVTAKGHVYAVDVNSWAIRRVRQKVEHAGINNITTLQGNAAESGLPTRSLDAAFLFGLPRVVGGLKSLILELRRVIKPGGLVSFQKSRRSADALVREMESAGFVLNHGSGRIQQFIKR